MKSILMSLLLIVGLMFVTNYSYTQPQSGPSDRQALAMLKEFYTAYITELSKWPLNTKKLNEIKKKYCTVSLLNKINAQLESGKLDSDPLLQAQDVDISWLKTLSFNRTVKRLNTYTVSYLDTASNEKVIMYLTVIKQGEFFKISSVQ